MQHVIQIICFVLVFHYMYILIFTKLQNILHLKMYIYVQDKINLLNLTLK